MFRKRKGPGDGGYNRISRLIEDRRRELEQGEGEDLDDDTIQLGQAGDSATPDEEEESVSLLSVRTPYRAASFAPAEEPEPFHEDRTIEAPLQGRWAASSLEEDTPPQAPSTSYATQYDEPTAAAEPMLVPDVGAVNANVTLVAVEATWEGKLHSEGDIRIEGTLRGELETAATLVVAPHARVHASIRARNIMLAGDVEGDITCEERLEILPGGSARGQINSAKLVVHEGAYIDSRFQMRRDGAEA